MTIQLDNLTITANVTEQTDSTHYEITSIRDRAGDELFHVSPLLLDQIEEAIEDHLTVERYETMMLDNEHAHLTHLYF